MAQYQLPFDSLAAAIVAQSEPAETINSGVAGGIVFVPPASTAPTLPPSYSVGEFVISNTDPGAEFAVPFDYTDIVNLSSHPVTIIGSGGSAPYEILGGTGGTTFYDSTSLGGSIAFGGGANTIAGSDSSPLQGNWLIDVGSGEPTDTDFIVLGSGVDTVQAGAAIVLGGGPGTVITDSNTDTLSSTVTVDGPAPCFLRGTLIRTPLGETPVETLSVGDRIVKLSGSVQSITWIGIGRKRVTRGQRSAATPVLVRKGALGDNVPHRDLRITKGHSLFLEGVLIPVECLINHRSIAWDDHAQEVELYHIELDTHEVLLANGAPAESYRDDGNRWLFQNATPELQFSPQPPCAPLLTDGPIVDCIWQRLLGRAGPRASWPLTQDADLYLLVDGGRVDAVEHRENGTHVFRLRSRPRNVLLRSRAAIPQELGIARDPRMLGVAVHRIVLAQARRQRCIEADSILLTEGYHAFEPTNDFRWTDGNAVVPHGLFAKMDGPAMLMVQLGATTQYLDDGTVQRAA